MLAKKTGIREFQRGPEGSCNICAPLSLNQHRNVLASYIGLHLGTATSRRTSLKRALKSALSAYGSTTVTEARTVFLLSQSLNLNLMFLSDLGKEYPMKTISLAPSTLRWATSQTPCNSPSSGLSLLTNGGTIR